MQETVSRVVLTASRAVKSSARIQRPRVESLLTMSSPEDVVLPIPNLKLAQLHFTLATPELEHLHDGARETLLAGIQQDREHAHASQHLR